MKSNVTAAGHPLHPIIVLLPAGAWITSLVLDIIMLATGNSFWFVASAWVMLIGIAGALLAAVTGAYDYFTLPMTGAPVRVGMQHMVLSLTITALYVINLLAIRLPAMSSAVDVTPLWGEMALWGFILNLVATVLLVVSGWLGGELVYRYGIAVPKETMRDASRYESIAGRGDTRLAGSAGGESRSDQE